MTVSAQGGPNFTARPQRQDLLEELIIPQVTVGGSSALEAQPRHASGPNRRAKQCLHHSPKMCLVSASSLPDSGTWSQVRSNAKKLSKTKRGCCLTPPERFESSLRSSNRTRTTTSGQLLQRAQSQGGHAKSCVSSL